jgi:prepilin-type N-terminal cleavage/methylation domain-containing protein
MKRREGDAGFTLVETMLALGVLAISLSACVISFDLSMEAVKTGANQMAALHSARLELETLRTLSLTNSSSLNAGTYAFTNGSVMGSYTVTNINSCTKNVSVSVAYLNYINQAPRKCIGTNTLTTTLTSTLHP